MFSSCRIKETALMFYKSSTGLKLFRCGGQYEASDWNDSRRWKVDVKMNRELAGRVWIGLIWLVREHQRSLVTAIMNLLVI